EEADRAKGQFLASMSHELRTPLNAILNYSEMLEEDLEGPEHEQHRADLGKVRAAGRHLLALINDILDLSKIEAGKMTLTLESFEVKPAVEEVLATVQALVGKSGNTLAVSDLAGLGAMYSDGRRLRQCLLNLLSNSCKFTEKGTVTLACSRFNRQGREWLAFRGIDTGIGVTEEQLEGLVPAFSQADSAKRRKQEGTGLGLAITRQFCRMMGGDVTAESEPGKGSTFTIYVPAAVESVTVTATDKTR